MDKEDVVTQMDKQLEEEEGLDSASIEETNGTVRGVTVRCGRCMERRFFCLSTPSKLNILTLICSGCGDVLSTGVMVEKVAEKKRPDKRKMVKEKEYVSYTG